MSSDSPGQGKLPVGQVDFNKVSMYTVQSDKEKCKLQKVCESGK